MNWLYSNWRFLLPSPWLEIAIVIASVLCGAIVGSERMRREKPAGLRTLMLVSLGSAVFMLISFITAAPNGDTGRIAANIVSGIGFLCAGVIMHGAGWVSGINTAAAIWAVAAIGTTVGTGNIPAGFALALLIRLVQAGGMRMEARRLRGCACEVHLVFDADNGKSRLRVERLMDEFHVSETAVASCEEQGNTTRMRLRLHIIAHSRREFLAELASLPTTREIQVEHP